LAAAAAARGDTRRPRSAATAAGASGAVFAFALVVEDSDASGAALFAVTRLPSPIDLAMLARASL